MTDAPDPPDGYSTKIFLWAALTLAVIAVSAYVLIRMD